MQPTLGVCYYPEHWPQERWGVDAQQMAAVGLRWVRIGEFAWSRIEPEPGRFCFEWLDQAIETLSVAGLQVVLGTPTATPPRWVLDKYPDMLAVGRDGNPRGFGSRRHYDFSHAGFREEAHRISALLAERYAYNPHIGFWQVDNEYSCHDTTLSYSFAALQGFRVWLQQRYTTIDVLNQAWGNVFWSMEYRAFGDIELPNLTVTEANPAHWQDFRRYSSDQVVAFNRTMVEAIRQYDPDTPILHNYMGRITDFDHFETGKDLDAASWDSYPLGFLEDRSEDGDAWKRSFMRQGDPDFQAFHHDLYRAVGKGRWWVMEQQPGPVNWAPYNPAPLPGMVRLWSWEAIAHGAEVVSYFRWRQAPFAQEQMHAGLLRPDAEPSVALDEVRQLAAELAQAGMTTARTATHTAPVALVFDYESAWAWETQPQGRGFSYFRLVFGQYRALRRLGLSVDICPPDCTDFTAYRLVLVPGLMHWKQGLWSALAACPGTVMLGPRTGSKTADFRIPASLPPACPALDVKVTQVESLRPDVGLPLSGGGLVQHWREYLQIGPDVTCLATVEDQPLVVQQGSVCYCGGELDLTGYMNLLEPLCRQYGLATVHLPEGLRLRQWGERVVVTNYSAEPLSLSCLKGAYAVEQDTLPAAGVCFITCN